MKTLFILTSLALVAFAQRAGDGVAFTVVDHAGAPVSGAEIRQEYYVFDGFDFAKAVGYDGACTTGEDGACEIEATGVPYGMVTETESVFFSVVTVFIAGEEIVSQSVDWKGGWRQVTFQLDETGKVPVFSHDEYEEDEVPTPTSAPDIHATATQIAINNAIFAPSATAAAATATAVVSGNTILPQSEDAPMPSTPLVVAIIIGIFGLVLVIFSFARAIRDTRKKSREEE